MWIVLYGMGKEYQNSILKGNVIDKIPVVAVVDKKWTERQSITLNNGSTVYGYGSIDSVQETFDKVLITSSKFYDEIKRELVSQGIESEKIESVKQWLYEELCYKAGNIMQGYGVDIGGPTQLFETIYLNARQCDIVNYSKMTVWSNLDEMYLLNDREIGKVIVADATDLHEIKDGTYDFVLSSNNIEHIANPIKALLEWKRVLKRGGIMVILAPAREYTFDHNRKYTLIEHVISDYEHNVGEDDLSHLEEILELHDLEMDKPAGSFEEFRERSIHNIENRCLHHHVFDAKLLEGMADYVGMKVISSGAVYGENHVIVMEKKI